ncbi:MAG: hypothetical protein IPG51_07010 [Chloroflexi bacterium]|nr:hypothetical protein [Chloroflexota bacterium]
MKHIPVILFGAGGVGSAVLRQIVDGRSPMPIPATTSILMSSPCATANPGSFNPAACPMTNCATSWRVRRRGR